MATVKPEFRWNVISLVLLPFVFLLIQGVIFILHEPLASLFKEGVPRVWASSALFWTLTLLNGFHIYVSFYQLPTQYAGLPTVFGRRLQSFLFHEGYAFWPRLVGDLIIREREIQKKEVSIHEVYTKDRVATTVDVEMVIKRDDIYKSLSVAAGDALKIAEDRAQTAVRHYATGTIPDHGYEDIGEFVLQTKPLSEWLREELKTHIEPLGFTFEQVFVRSIRAPEKLEDEWRKIKEEDAQRKAETKDAETHAENIKIVSIETGMNDPREAGRQVLARRGKAEYRVNSYPEAQAFGRALGEALGRTLRGPDNRRSHREGEDS